MTTRTRAHPLVERSERNILPLLGIDHLEFWVGNAHQAAQFYRHAFGFDIIGYAGPETGLRDRASYVLQQNKITFVVTAGLLPDSSIVRHVARHGDGIRDIALRVSDARAAYEEATERGATPAAMLESSEDAHGIVRRAAITMYGDTIHSFIDRSRYAGTFLPGYQPVEGHPGDSVGLQTIDHVVANVELGEMERWSAFYREVMGFRQLVHFTDEAISTEYTALMSKVMQDGTGRIKFPINEPAPGKRRSQIQEYLDFYRGPGVQHIALHTNDIIATVRTLRRRGVEFLQVPDDYYTSLRDRIGHIAENMVSIRKLGILVDRDDEGYLLQIFTKPVQDRPTLFFEIIQRHGATGFGVGNFKALFEAIEAEQGRRGNL